MAYECIEQYLDKRNGNHTFVKKRRLTVEFGSVYKRYIFNWSAYVVDDVTNSVKDEKCPRE